MRILGVAAMVWITTLMGVAFLLQGSSQRPRALTATGSAAAGSLVVLYCIHKKRTG